MKTFKVIGNCCLVFLSVIAVCISIAFCYYHFFVKDITIGVNNISEQIGLDIINSEDLTEEQKMIYADRYFLEANYYSNSKNNGIELQELNFNYFRDYTLTSDKYRSTGMQYIGNYKHHDVSVSSDSERDNYVFNDFCYYDTTDGISYTGYTGNNAGVSTILKRSTSFTIKIDNRAFEIQLDKFWSKKYGWWIFGRTDYHYYTYSELFESVMKSLKTAGYGDYYITLDLSDYFTIREYDMETGKCKEDNVTDIIKNYAVLKFHYDENGANKASQSLFKQIECNRNYGMVSEVDTTYWQERLNYTLETDTQYLNKTIFNYRYSEVYDGYFISMTMDAKKLFAEMPRTKVNIYLDLNSEYLQSKEINVVGIDYNGFESLEIDTLTINGENQTFYVLDKGLSDTQLQTLKHTAGITFDFATNSINSEYVEVVL